MVIGKPDGEPPDLVRDPGRHGDGAGAPVVGGKERMVPADGDRVAARVGARQPYRRGRRVRRVDPELHHLRARDQVDEPLRRLPLDPVWPDEAEAQPHGLPRRAECRLIPVAEEVGARPATEFNVLVAVYSLPSMSQTWQPKPRSMKGAIPAGYWSAPLA